MAVKTWVVEAEKIVYGPMNIWKDGDVLRWLRQYHFEDAGGNTIRVPDEGLEFIPHPHMTGKVAWENVSQDIKDALIQIDEYTKLQIRQKEGI